MKYELRSDDLPEWDGRPSSALEWFATVQEVAGMGGWVPFQMGQYLWLRLKDGSDVRAWYSMLTPDWKSWM